MDVMKANEMTQEDWDNLAKAGKVRRYHTGRKLTNEQGKVSSRLDANRESGNIHE